MPTLVYINYIPARRCRLCAEATGCQKGSSVPTPEDFIEVDALPLLSNGKLDLVKIKELANSE